MFALLQTGLLASAATVRFVSALSCSRLGHQGHIFSSAVGSRDLLRLRFAKAMKAD